MQMPPEPHPGPAGSRGPRRLPGCPAGSPVLTDSTPEEREQRGRADFFLMQLQLENRLKFICPTKVKSQAEVRRPSCLPTPLECPYISPFYHHGSSQSVFQGTPEGYPPHLVCKSKTIFIIILRYCLLFPFSSSHEQIVEFSRVMGHVISGVCRIKQEISIVFY